MIAVLLSWELCSSVSRDEVSELRGLSFELSGLVFWVDLLYGQYAMIEREKLHWFLLFTHPIEDIFLIRLLRSHVSKMLPDLVVELPHTDDDILA